MIKKDWWDGRNPDSFFPLIYRVGDDSLEGHLEGIPLNVEQRTQRECDLIESVLEIRPPAKILDCPCGYGRHSLEMSKRGYDVTGVDLCPQFIEEARKNAALLPSGSSCRFVQADMRHIPNTLTDFDICINMFFSFGYFDHEDNLSVLSGFHRILKPGGKLFIHTDVNPDAVLNGSYGDRTLRTLKDDRVLHIDERYDPETKSLIGEWTIDDSNGSVSRAYSIRIYTNEELSQMLQSAGFFDIEIFFPENIHSMTNGANQEVVYVGGKQ